MPSGYPRQGESSGDRPPLPCVYVIRTHTHVFKSAQIRATAGRAWFSLNKQRRTSLSNHYLGVSKRPDTQIHAHHVEHLERKPVTLAFYQLICCCYRNGICGGRLCACVCVFTFSTGATSVTEILYKIKSLKHFAIASINCPSAGAALLWVQSEHLL